MGRLRRFPDHRIIGRRDQMIAYDCDDDAQFAELAAATDTLGLDLANLLQSFAPDTPAEARNRGFRPAPASRSASDRTAGAGIGSEPQ